MTQELYYKAMTSMELDEDAFKDIADAKDAPGKPKKASGTTSVGRLANLMSADVDAIWAGRDVILITFGIPAGTIVALVGLYKLTSWPALIGTAFMLILTPLPWRIAQFMGRTQQEVRKRQDSRISLLSEYLGSIRAIKYFAWEDAIIKKIDEARFAEQKQLWRISLL